MINRAIFFAKTRQELFGGVLRQSQVDGLNAILDEWEKRMPTRDLRWLAYMLATVLWETSHTMQPVREAFWLSENWRRANLRYWPFYGRGYVQLTWHDNYQRLGDLVKLDLVGNPDLALDPHVAADVMFLGMEQGLFTGRKLADYFLGAREDWNGARAIINGDDDVDHNNVPDSIDIGNLGRVFFAVLQAATLDVRQATLL